ncbi:MAG: hypothetical protein KAJ73_09005 [Zetaproteobacteria bacterium]|nr:hypothetical protein [Zetaproteobacteria bacterium]
MTEKTLVVFRFWLDSREPIALFPEIDAGGGLCQSYMHVGQHGGANYSHVVKMTALATPEEYAPLVEELEIIGYSLDIRTKWSRR